MLYTCMNIVMKKEILRCDKKINISLYECCIMKKEILRCDKNTSYKYIIVYHEQVNTQMPYYAFMINNNLSLANFK